MDEKDTTIRKSLRAYILGFALSIILTALAFMVVMNHVFEKTHTVTIIISLAIIQLFVQLIFFLHLSQESQPRWRLVTLSFGVLVVAIVVFGSLWIMDHLNYNMMHNPENMHHYMEKQGGF